jgi:bacterioferritin-associated ferredoxin
MVRDSTHFTCAYEAGTCVCLACQFLREEQPPHIPQMLWRLADAIFEGLPSAMAMRWPRRFLSAVKAGSDLSRVGWQFLHWLLTDETVNPGINDPAVRDAVKQCADVLAPLTNGQPVDVRAARRAASAALSAAWSAAWSAARRAASAAWTAESAARSAASAALSAAWSAAWSAARRAASAEDGYVRMSDKLIELIEAAP